MSCVHVTHQVRCEPRRQAGFSLVECMVSFSLGLLLVLALLALLDSASSSAKTIAAGTEIHSAGRFALASLMTELRHAGFSGFTAGSIRATQHGTEPAHGCTLPGGSISSFLGNLEQPVWGRDNGNPFAGAGNCLPVASYVSGTDVLVLRRLSTVATTELEPGGFYVRSAYGQGQLFRAGEGSSLPATGSAAGPGVGAQAVFALQVFVYYISPISSSDNEDNQDGPVPGLWRLFLRNDGLMERQLVASGVERMQVQYGVAEDGRLAFYDAPPPLGTVRAGEQDEAKAPSVRALRLWLLLRSARPESGAQHAQSYAMGNQPYRVVDGYRRELLSTTVHLRN